MVNKDDTLTTYIAQAFIFAYNLVVAYYYRNGWMVDKIGAMDWKYFWKQQDDIPAVMGYQLFGSAHLISVAVTICIVIAGVILICKRKIGEKIDDANR